MKPGEVTAMKVEAWFFKRTAKLRYLWRAFWHRRKCRACCLFTLGDVARFERNKEEG